MFYHKLLNPLPQYFRYVRSLNFSQVSKHISFKQYGKVGMIGINRPEKRNALDSHMIKDLTNVIHEFENDESSHVGVLYGEGGNFCAGFDLGELANEDGSPDDFRHNNFTENFVKKPLIGAVNGFAVGFGFDLAMLCDIRVMDETAVLGCYGRRFGTSMSAAGIGRLQAIVGLSKAMDLILSGRSVKSDEALQCGLANRIVSCGTAVGQALRFGMDLCKFPEAGMLADRAVLYKHVFSKIRLKNSIIDSDAEQYKEQAVKDTKKGAKLFASGVGRNGKLFPHYLWDDK